MLNDPLIVAMPPTLADLQAQSAIWDYLGSIGTAGNATLRATLEGDGVSKRKGKLDAGTTVTQSVSHSTSKENAPYVTDRTSIRFDFSRVDPVTGKPVTASAYCVLALPQSSAFSTEDGVLCGAILANFVLQGGISGNIPPRVYDGLPGETLARLLSGEA